jgi:hypothetical protein
MTSVSSPAVYMSNQSFIGDLILYDLADELKLIPFGKA